MILSPGRSSLTWWPIGWQQRRHLSVCLPTRPQSVGGRDTKHSLRWHREVLPVQLSTEATFEAADAHNKATLADGDSVLYPVEDLIVGADGVPQLVVDVEILVEGSVTLLLTPRRNPAVFTGIEPVVEVEAIDQDQPLVMRTDIRTRSIE